jgi:regulator of replication initiation timing
VKRNHRNAGSAPSRWRRRAYVRRTVLSTPPAMTKAEVGGETPGMRKAASETIDRRVEPAPSPAVVDRARVADVEPLRPSRAAAENDELVAVRERLARLDRTLQEFERKAAPDENARRLDAITLRLDKVAASLIQLEQRDGRRDGSTDRDLALWQAKLQPAIEGLRRLDQLEAAVRTLEHISFAKTQRDEELGARIATLEESKSRLPGPPTSEVVVAPLSNQIRELAQSVSDWKASVTATLQTIVAENESLKDRLARSNDTPAKAAAAAPPMPAGDGHAEFGELKERIDAIGRVIAELNLKVERIPAAKQPEEISRRLELLEQKLAHGPSDATGDATGAPADLLRKVKDVEQMVVRSMSEWGRLFNDLEERMARNERAAKLKK